MSQNGAASSLSSALRKAASPSVLHFLLCEQAVLRNNNPVSYYPEERIQFGVETKPLLQKQVIPKEQGSQYVLPFHWTPSCICNYANEKVTSASNHFPSWKRRLSG